MTCYSRMLRTGVSCIIKPGILHVRGKIFCFVRIPRVMNLMLKWLAKKFGSKRIDDPVFGSLLFMKMKDPSRSYWEGREWFAPVSAEVQIFVDGGEDGPRPSQHETYNRMAERYPKILHSIEPLLRREYTRTWLGEMGLPEARFRLNSLSVPAVESESVQWDMDFSCDGQDDWLFTVHMEGWRPTGKVSVMH